MKSSFQEGMYAFSTGSHKDVGSTTSKVTHQEARCISLLQGAWLVYFNEQVLIYCWKHLWSLVITCLCASENATIPCCGKELAVSILGSN